MTSFFYFNLSSFTSLGLIFFQKMFINRLEYYKLPIGYICVLEVANDVMMTSQILILLAKLTKMGAMTFIKCNEKMQTVSHSVCML